MRDEIAQRFRRDLIEWSKDNIRDFPWRESDASPYEILLAEIFLKQTRSQTVAEILPEFVERFPSIEAIRESSKEEIIEVIQPLGLYNYRADTLKEIAEELDDGEIPRTKPELQELPQVDPYVASATLCFAFNERHAIVDSNIRRVYQRLFGEGIEEKSEADLWTQAEFILPADDFQRFNLALLDFGAEICTDSSPNCEECFAQEYCMYYQTIHSEPTSEQS